MAAQKVILNILIGLNVLQQTWGCPDGSVSNVKAAYKSGEIRDMNGPLTMDRIKGKLRETGIFDEDVQLTDREKKELGKLYDAVEISLTSRNRQPTNVQNVFSSLRLVERAVKKQVKEGQISESLASKFHWEKLN